MDAVTSFFSNLATQIQEYLTNMMENRKRDQIRRMQAETTRQQWGDDKVFKQNEGSKVSNVAFKKPDAAPKKEPLLK